MNRKLAILSLATTLSLTGCNKDILDMNKSYNVAIEKENNNISAIGIISYKDYIGNQISYKTKSGLEVLTSSKATTIGKVNSKEVLESMIQSLKDENDKVIYYDEIDYNYIWNKNLIDLTFSYDKALLINDDIVTIYDIKEWTDYEKDEKIQLILQDGTVLLLHVDNIKLVSTKSSTEEDFLEYVSSIAGTKEIKNYNSDKKIIK